MEIIECICGAGSDKAHANDCPCRAITAPARATKAFEIVYQSDAGCPRFTARVFANSQEHAEFIAQERFASDGWEVLCVDRPRDGWGKVTTKFDLAA